MEYGVRGRDFFFYEDQRSHVRESKSPHGQRFLHEIWPDLGRCKLLHLRNRWKFRLCTRLRVVRSSSPETPDLRPLIKPSGPSAPSTWPGAVETGKHFAYGQLCTPNSALSALWRSVGLMIIVQIHRLSCERAQKSTVLNEIMKQRTL